MQGDIILITEFQRSAAADIVPIILPKIKNSEKKFTISVAGESGSGKSELAAAVANELKAHGYKSIILQQDDYFLFPPKSNDMARRKDITWVGPQEVKLDDMDKNLQSILDNAADIKKPLVQYKEDKIVSQTLPIGDEKVVITEGTYTSLLKNIDLRIFIDRNYEQTREHRERRNRDASELDAFTDKVLIIEHGIISKHRKLADIIVHEDYSVSEQK